MMQLRKANEEIDALKTQLSMIDGSAGRAPVSAIERVMLEDKIRRDAALIEQMRRELEFLRKQRDDLNHPLLPASVTSPHPPTIPFSSALSSGGDITVPPPPPPVTAPSVTARIATSERITTRVSDVPPLWMAHGIAQPQRTEEKSGCVTPSPASSPVAISTMVSSTTSSAGSGGTLVLDKSVLYDSVFGYCSSCERATDVQVSRRCNKCHNEDIAEVATSNWTELIGQYNGCSHMSDACANTRWEFVATCRMHPEKKPDKHCPLLPGVVANTTAEVCGGCNSIQAIVLRFDCGHFICLSKCWRNYARIKLDNRELLFNIPVHGSDATLACPAGCRFYVQSHNLFKLLGKARYEQYQTLGMEYLVGRPSTPESKEGRLALTARIPPAAHIKKCPRCTVEHARHAPSGQRTHNNRIHCDATACQLEWCWHCESEWKPTCKRDHLISRAY